MILNDSLIIITSNQLKQTNLIFLEHNKLNKERIELIGQLDSYKILVDNYNKSLNVRSEEIVELNSIIIDQSNKIQLQDKQLKNIDNKYKIIKGIAIGGVTISIVLLLLLIN